MCKAQIYLIAVALLALSGCVAETDGWEAETEGGLEERSETLIVDTDFDGDGNDGIIPHATRPSTGRPYGDCTATYLERANPNDPPVVLTAAHCVENGAGNIIATRTDTMWLGSGMGFRYYEDTAATPGPATTAGGALTDFRFFPFREILVPNGYTNNGVVEEDDVALIVLRDVPRFADGTEIPGSPLLDVAPTLAGTFTAVGYGCTGTTQTYDHRKREGRTWPTSIDGNGYIGRNGDVHDGTSTMDRGASTCPGDSGGPLFMTQNGAERIAGVMSGGSGWGSVANPSAMTDNHNSLWVPVYTGSQMRPWINQNRFGACGAGSWDGNDWFNNATELNGYEARTHNGNINCSTDDDYYKFFMHAGDTLDVRIAFNHAFGDLDAELLQANRLSHENTVVESQTQLDLSNGTSNSEVLSYTATSAGYVYLRVYGYSGATENYRLQVHSDDGRTNTTKTNAASLSQGTTSGHTVSWMKDQWFQIDYDANWSMALTAEFIDSEGDVDITIEDAGGTIHRQFVTSSDDEVVPLGNLSGLAYGTYYIRIFGFSGDANTFDLQVVPELYITSTSWPSSPDGFDWVDFSFTTNIPARTRCYGPKNTIFVGCVWGTSDCTRQFDKDVDTTLKTNHSCRIRLDTDNYFRYRYGAYTNTLYTVPDFNAWGTPPSWDERTFLSFP